MTVHFISRSKSTQLWVNLVCDCEFKNKDWGAEGGWRDLFPKVNLACDVKAGRHSSASLCNVIPTPVKLSYYRDTEDTGAKRPPGPVSVREHACSRRGDGGADKPADDQMK